MSHCWKSHAAAHMNTAKSMQRKRSREATKIILLSEMIAKSENEKGTIPQNQGQIFEPLMDYAMIILAN